ncbi:MAG: hypothetical protein EZS28_053734, partial [Streblomastix strix]
MSICRLSQSCSFRICEKETSFMERVRRNVLRLLEFRIREILASFKFQDTNLEPEDQDYEVKIEHDTRLTWPDDRHGNTEKDNIRERKESIQQELLSELKEIDKSIKRKRSPESEQSSRSSRESKQKHHVSSRQGHHYHRKRFR